MYKDDEKNNDRNRYHRSIVVITVQTLSSTALMVYIILSIKFCHTRYINPDNVAYQQKYF